MQRKEPNVKDLGPGGSSSKAATWTGAHDDFDADEDER
jgi:hypothetical protein